MIDMLIPDEWVLYLEKIKSRIDVLEMGLSNQPYYITARTITNFNEYFICQKKFTRYTILDKAARIQQTFAEAFALTFFNELSDDEKDIFKRINRNIYNVLKVHVKFNDFCWPFYIIEALQKCFYEWDKHNSCVNDAPQLILKINKSLQEQGFGEL